MEREATSVLRIAVAFIFLAATIWMVIIGMTTSKDIVNSAAEDTERSLEHSKEYLINYVAAGEKVVPVAEAYALFCYNTDIISECECRFCGKTTPSFGECCLKMHLTGNCKVSFQENGAGGYRMLVQPES